MRTTVINDNTKHRWPIYGVIAASLAVLFLPTSGHAQIDCKEGAGYSCTYDLELEGRQIQKVPNAFKFQAKISQAKLPVGDVTFPSIFVLLKRGDTTICEEELNNVMVRDSVLNMEIGRGMINCNLDDIIANNNDIGIDVCIQNKDNCLKRIKLSTVPYAVKASFANTAQKAHSANEAIQCNYAHRVTADRNLFVNQAIGKGYYDFHTPAAEDLDLLNTALLDDDAQSLNGGYIQWTPVDPVYPNLHISAKNVDSASNKPINLKELIFHAEKTKTAGVAVIYGDQLSGTYDLIVHGDVRVLGSERIDLDLDVGQNAVINGSATVLNGATIENGAVISGTDTTRGLEVNDGARVWGGAEVYGALMARNWLVVDDGAEIYGPTYIYGNFYANAGHSPSYFGSGITANNGMDIAGGADITGGLTVDSLQVGGDTVVGQSELGEKQNRVYGSCGTDQYVQQVHEDGSVTCGSVRSISGDLTIMPPKWISAYQLITEQIIEKEAGGTNLLKVGSSDATVLVRGSTKFDCPSCGSSSALNGSSDWGDLTIQGRVISANNRIRLSPPGGYNVVISDDYRAAGGSSSADGAGLEVEGNITGGNDIDAGHNIHAGTHVYAGTNMYVGRDISVGRDVLVDDDVIVEDDLTVKGTINYYSLNNMSDRRLKTEITDISNSLEVVGNLRGVSYQWKDTEKQGNGTHYGFIAQEVKEVLPEIVGTEGEYLSVSYIEVVPYLVEAIKEQQYYIDELRETCQMAAFEDDQLEALEQEVEAQKEINRTLRAQMNQMQAQINALVAAR